MIMTEKQDDEWYTEEDINTKSSWNRLEEQFVNVRPIPAFLLSLEPHSHRLVIAKE